MAEKKTLIIKKNRRLIIPDIPSVVKLWNIIAPVVVKEIAPEYLPISNLMDTNAFNIGNIFVQTAGQISCFGNSPLLRVLGPLRNYVKNNETDEKWIVEEFPTVKKFPEKQNFNVTIQHNGNELLFAGEKYYFLSKPDDFVLEKNVTIDRRTNEDLRYVDWFGLIRDVVVTEMFQLKLETKEFGRALEIGDKPHVVLFKYELYEIDAGGKIQRSLYCIPNLPWEGLQCACQDGLPLPTL